MRMSLLDAPNGCMSFSTGFFHSAGDGINAENAVTVGRSIQKKLDDQPPTAKIEKKMKVQSLAKLRQNATGSDVTKAIWKIVWANTK